MALCRPLTKVASPRVLVLGGGIAGLTAALEVAGVGLPVTLVEEGPSLGGLMAQLDKTFPTNDCAMCILAPRLLEVARHPLIEIMTLTELVGLAGEAGDFQAFLVRRPRYVDPAKCTGCGECTRVCPRRLPDPFNLGLSRTKAIHVPFPQAVPQAAYIIPEACRHLKGRKEAACLKVCLAGAINFADRPETLRMSVGAVILAPGARPAEVGDFPGAEHPDVVTSLEFERLLSATGPTAGRLRRPSDGREPQTVAFIQCVGSRKPGSPVAYCSSFCCLASLKEAVVAHELTQERLAATLFYMDLRAPGKEQERYVDLARTRGVELVRSRVTKVTPHPQGGVLVRYADAWGQPRERRFDLAVLALGLRPADKIREWARRLNLPLNEWGFLKAQPYGGGEAGRPGVFLCGSATEPMDITTAVTTAGAAAQAAAELLALAPRPSLVGVTRPRPLPPDNQPLQVGVFLCHCGTNIAGTIDLGALAQEVRRLPGVAWVEEFLFSCSADATRKMAETIKTHRLNRVVVAACSPRTHEPVFREVLINAGLNQGYLAFANLREQCAWVHQNEPERALAKARDLVAMAVARARELGAITPLSYPVVPRALILGGGVAGMSAALSLADQGFHTYLVEKADRLGGLARRLHFSLEEVSPPKLVQELEAAVRRHPNVEVLTRAELVNLEGAVGRFRAQVRLGCPPDDILRSLEHGVLLVATGGQEITPRGQFLYGEDPRVLTQMELEERLALGARELAQVKRTVMIQCVGSRSPERPYCSRLCCSEAVKNAILLRKRHPLMEVVVLYRDLRAFGFRELDYQEAKDKGVVFIPYDPSSPPQVSAPKRRPLLIKVKEVMLGETLSLNADLLVLSAGIEPAPGTRELARILKIPTATGGFFLEAHQKLKPVETVTEGIFLCGMAHYPKSLKETVAQAQAAALKAAALLFQVEIHSGETVAEILPFHCRRCLACAKLCPFRAISLGEGGRPFVLGELCRGCGLCVAECPGGAIRLSRFTDAEVTAQIEAALTPLRGEEYVERKLLRSVR
jgi:heterodisulfide reductase subunit A|uniref:CoB--CoM heterodisulfide reductase iron-sulfur subunit A family protein n=1 Tax=Desulfobacca acetoxidans TaxID=60893 RepID=A0A7C5AKH0_9BACT